MAITQPASPPQQGKGADSPSCMSKSAQQDPDVWPISSSTRTLASWAASTGDSRRHCTLRKMLVDLQAGAAGVGAKKLDQHRDCSRRHGAVRKVLVDLQAPTQATSGHGGPGHARSDGPPPVSVVWQAGMVPPSPDHPDQPHQGEGQQRRQQDGRGGHAVGGGQAGHLQQVNNPKVRSFSNAAADISTHGAEGCAGPG